MHEPPVPESLKSHPAWFHHGGTGSGGGLLLLGVEDIRLGVTNRRNPTLTGHATQILPYRGLGSGILRALGEWPDIRLENEVTSKQFKTVIPRTLTDTPQVTLQVGMLLSRL
jgi:hypothetical protein